MMNNKTDTLHRIVLKVPGIIEKVIAAILLVGIVYGCVRLAIQVLFFSPADYVEYIEELLVTAFNIVIVIEFIRMLVKHSMNTIIEVLIFAIARGLVVGHEEPVQELISILAIAILLFCRKFFFHEFDFKEEDWHL